MLVERATESGSQTAPLSLPRTDDANRQSRNPYKNFLKSALAHPTAGDVSPKASSQTGIDWIQLAVCG